MKRFKAKYKRNNILNINILLLTIILTTIYLIRFYNNLISERIISIAETKIEEVTNIYIKNNIVPKNVDLDKLVTISMNNNNEILSLDIDNTYANEIMIDVVRKIQNNIFEMDIQDDMLKKKDNNTYISVPLMLGYDGVFLANFGPRIPIKLSFYEHAFGNIEVKLTDYGINNAMVKVILSISLEQKLYIPYKNEKSYKKFDLIIGTKIINGKVPNIYGGSMIKSSEILSQ